MDKLLAMHAFVETADRGSIKQAAAALGKSPPTLVRLLNELESELGVLLLRRSTRRSSLTREGELYLEHSRRILADIREAESELGSADGQARGQVRVTAPVLFGQLHVTPALVEFAQRYPAIALDILLMDRVANLVEEGIDVAVRIGPLADSALITRSVGQMRQIVVASPSLLLRAGTPQHPLELTERPCIHFASNTTGACWRFEETASDGRKRPLSVQVKGAYRVNHAGAAVAACAGGLGFGSFLAYQAAELVAKDKLVTVLDAFECPPTPVSLVYAQARLMPARLRCFLDFMAPRLGASLSALGAGLSASDKPLPPSTSRRGPR